MNFGPAVISSDDVIYSQKPLHHSEDMDVSESFDAFDGNLWMCIASVFLLMAFSLSIFQNNGFVSNFSVQFLCNFWQIFRMVINQAFGEFTNLWCKYIGSYLILFTFVLTAYFLNLFASNLVVVKQPPLVENVKQLNAKESMRPVFLKQLPSIDQFKYSTNSEYRKLWERVK